MWFVAKYFLKITLLVLGFLATFICLIIVMVSTKTVLLTILSGLGLIYSVYAAYFVIQYFLDK